MGMVAIWMAEVPLHFVETAIQIAEAPVQIAETAVQIAEAPVSLLAISGSLRAVSSNTALLRAALLLAPDGVEITDECAQSCSIQAKTATGLQNVPHCPVASARPLPTSKAIAGWIETAEAHGQSIPEEPFEVQVVCV